MANPGLQKKPRATRKTTSRSRKKQPELLLSTDSLSGYGLDLIFQIASEYGYDGIDLAMRKNFDAWSIEYVTKLTKKYKLPVKVIQISSKVNIKEMNQAVDLAKALEAEVITINSPEIFNIQSYRFLTKHLPAYKAHNKQIKFAIINPQEGSYIGIIPKYYFKNMVQIIKKYTMYLGLDITNMNEEVLEYQFMRKISNFIPYLGVVYLSDVDKRGRNHLPLGDGQLKLELLLKKFKQFEYEGPFSIKLNLPKKTLADIDKVEVLIKKCRVYFTENFTDLKLD